MFEKPNRQAMTYSQTGVKVMRLGSEGFCIIVARAAALRTEGHTRRSRCGLHVRVCCCSKAKSPSISARASLLYLFHFLLKSENESGVWQLPTLTWGDPTLPSARLRFTSEFGMDSGGSTALLSPDKFFCLDWLIVRLTALFPRSAAHVLLVHCAARSSRLCQPNNFLRLLTNLCIWKTAFLSYLRKQVSSAFRLFS